MSRKALHVGINQYAGAPLNGCVNDEIDMVAEITAAYGFAKQDIHILLDKNATTQNILNELNWLVADTKPGDTRLFHYSGHGTQVPTRDRKSEPDGLSEVICPVEFDWTPAHMITDKQFVGIFSRMPSGVIFNWLSDSCHSGDLDRKMVRAKKECKNQITPRLYPHPFDIKWAIDSTREIIAEEDHNTMPRGILNGKLEVGFISGCRSNQTSADAYIKGRYNGAFTYYFLQALKANRNAPLTVLVADINRRLKAAGYAQQPQAEGTRVNSPFLG